VLTIT